MEVGSTVCNYAVFKLQHMEGGSRQGSGSGLEGQVKGELESCGERPGAGPGDVLSPEMFHGN